MTARWVVHKFGGTSVANARGFEAAARILLSLHRDEERSAVVVSAMSGVTDGLLELLDLAASRNDDYLAKLHGLKERHLHTMAHLGLSAAPQQSLAESIAADFKNIEEVLRGVWITGLPSERTSEFVTGHGELWSANCCMRIWKTPGIRRPGSTRARFSSSNPIAARSPLTGTFREKNYKGGKQTQTLPPF